VSNGRNFDNWLASFVDYASFGEAPKRMYFWVGVSAVAGALRRKVWIDQAYFKWYANFYIVLVAPPGIVSKSTTAAISMNLLRKVPGVKFGPDVITWQSLVTSLAEAGEHFKLGETYYPMSPMTIESSEFGNLLNPHDRDMVDLLVSLWDGRDVFSKQTKMSGNDTVECPWLNIVACTTPSWIAGNFPEYMIGGGFTSRCIFVYADTKEKFVAYPGEQVPKGLGTLERKLVQDLEHISVNLTGNYELTPEAVRWGTSWYEEHYKHRPEGLDDDRFGGYIARKQTHIHKLAMILAAAQRDQLVILPEDLALAHTMVTDLERDMPQVFAKIGKDQNSVYTEQFLQFLKARGKIPYTDGFAYLHGRFPNAKDLEGIVAGCVKAGFIEVVNGAEGYLMRYTGAWDKTLH